MAIRYWVKRNKFLTIRRSKGISQKIVGRIAGRDGPMISNLERGITASISESVYRRLVAAIPSFAAAFEPEDDGQDSVNVGTQKTEPIGVREVVIEVAKRKGVSKKAIDLLPTSGPNITEYWVKELRVAIEVAKKLEYAETATERMLLELELEEQIGCSRNCQRF